MKRVINLLILTIIIIFVLLMVSGTIHYSCIFKRIFNICCPGCGLTRSFRCILNFDFIEAIKYNILGIPLFVSFIVFSIMLIFDIIKNSNTSIKVIMNVFKNYYLMKNNAYGVYGPSLWGIVKVTEEKENYSELKW